MTKRGRPPVLDDFKTRDILALLSMGCSRRTAARYVGCAVSTIRNTARRDPKFAEALGQAECNLEIAYLSNVQKAARKEQYWRAAAWALERRKPEDYAPRGPNVITVEQLQEVLGELAGIIVEEVPVARHRKRIVQRVDALVAGLRRSIREETSHEPH
jgi:hypothetical protein